MKIEKTTEKIVCDVTGCGNLADYLVTSSTGAKAFVCKRCLKEADDALKEKFKRDR